MQGNQFDWGQSQYQRRGYFNENSDEESKNDVSGNSDNNEPLSIDIRKKLLEQCNYQYEENFVKSHHKSPSNERSRCSRSPYGPRDRSVSPNCDDKVEGVIQGNIDGNMTSQQIISQKAFVWAFGKNQEGQLALGVYKDALVPRYITSLKGLVAKWIATSNHHTALITTEGQLVVSGSSLHGKLGIENLSKTNLNKFQIVPALQRKKAKQVSCGDYHTICLMEDGTVYQFGGSTFKDKKDKIQRPSSQQQTVPPSVPQPIQSLYGKDIIQIDCGDFHSVALDANGDLYTWGGGASAYNKGQCGHGHTNMIEFPEKVKHLQSKRIIQVSCGGFHTLVLTSEGEVYAFGSGCYGECGYGEFLDTAKPKLVKFPNDRTARDTDDFDRDFFLGMYLKELPIISQIAAGGRHSLAVCNNGKLYSFGYGSNGQLGLRSTSNYSKPQLVKDLQTKPIVNIAAGWSHSVVISDRGDVFVCGYGGHGQLGLGDKASKTQFTFVQSLGNKNIDKIFAGGNHTWVVLNQVVPIREHWNYPSPAKDNFRSSSNTPQRGNNNNSIGKSGSKTIGKNQSTSASPLQHRNLQNDQNKKFSMSSATFGHNNISFNKAGKEIPYEQKIQNIPQGDDFVQKVIDIQHQQLMKAQYYVQVTYCETEFCHRFVNFEVHGQFIKQFEQMLEDYIQACYQQEKGTLYHKIQEVPQEFFKKNIKSQRHESMTPGERLIKETQNEGLEDNSREDSDIEEEFGQKQEHKSYTLCVICNPSSCGYDQDLEEWKRNNSGQEKAKKIVINSTQLQVKGQSIQTAPSDENQQPLIGKIVFIKDSDIENNYFEERMSQWMTNFNRKLAKYCIKKPRYSELRPMKFSLT